VGHTVNADDKNPLFIPHSSPWMNIQTLENLNTTGHEDEYIHTIFIIFYSMSVGGNYRAWSNCIKPGEYRWRRVQGGGVSGGISIVYCDM